MKVKVRIAPSPTGFLHIGTAQSALYNWLFARKKREERGEFYLRIEDTDRERSTKEYEQSILDALEWLGLKWDGEVVHQSERTESYEKRLRQLFDDDDDDQWIFWCHHTKEELEEEAKHQLVTKQPPRHICEHKNTELGKTKGQVLRLNVSTGGNRVIVFNDEIRGEIGFEEYLLGDFAVAKDFDQPLYNFAVVVDDIDMGITHVIRGEDHISNTPKQILIHEAITKVESEHPKFAHLPLILAPDRSKLSKRHGATAVMDFKKDYLPEAIINFLGAISFTFSKEILTKEEMIKEFELSKVHKSGAVFDVKKLNWVNSQYVKKLSSDEFKKTVGMPEIPDSAVPLITERLEKLSDVENFSYLWKEPEYGKELLIWKNSTKEEVKNSLETVKNIFQGAEFANSQELRIKLDALGAQLGNRGLAYWPLRVALTGKEKSPDPVEVASVLDKEESLKRINNAIKKL